MTIVLKFLIKLLCSFSVGTVLFSGPATAGGSKTGNTVHFHQAFEEAYGHYREAYFYLRRDNVMVAIFELEAMISKWHLFEQKYAGHPPALYAKDVEWKDTLNTVGAISRKALEMVTKGEPKSAYDILTPVRFILSKLRKRNGVITFRDYVEAANLAFRELFIFRHDPPNFDDSTAVRALRKHVVETIGAYQNCLDKAPPKAAKDEQFKRLINDSLYYLERIEIAIGKKSKIDVINILRRVVSSNNLLWLRFG